MGDTGSTHSKSGQASGAASAVAWAIDDLKAELLTTMSTRVEGAHCAWFENRVVGLLASQELGNASKIAVGVSGVPPGVATVEHRHEAEEVAIVVSGNGFINIGGEEHPVSLGSVVIAPSQVPHTTRASEEPLLILWIYAPPGSQIARNRTLRVRLSNVEANR